MSSLCWESIIANIFFFKAQHLLLILLNFSSYAEDFIRATGVKTSHSRLRTSGFSATKEAIRIRTEGAVMNRDQGTFLSGIYDPLFASLRKTGRKPRGSEPRVRSFHASSSDEVLSVTKDEKFSKIKSKCCALKKNIFAIMENFWNFKRVPFVLELSWNFVKLPLKM